MPINVSTIIDRGGRDLADLLEYCVLSVKTDLLFVFLVREYRNRPTAANAVAIHEMFCAADAPARISADGLLPPKDMRLEQTLAPYRQAILCQMKEAAAADEEMAPGPSISALMPPKYLFDAVVDQLSQGAHTALAEVEQQYEPSLTPHENLPGGRLTASQRAFVDNIWLPIVRPRLVAAGFWRMATVG